MNDIIKKDSLDEEGKIKNSVRTTREEDDDDDDDVNDTDSDEGNIIIKNERVGGGTTATTATSKLKQKLRESRKKETRKVEFMQKIIEEQKLLLMDEQARSNQFEQQVKLLQKSVKLLEKECDSLSVKMSEMFEKNAEKAHLNERIRQAERAAGADRSYLRWLHRWRWHPKAFSVWSHAVPRCPSSGSRTCTRWPPLPPRRDGPVPLP